MWELAVEISTRLLRSFWGRSSPFSEHAAFPGDPFVLRQCVSRKLVSYFCCFCLSFRFDVVHVDHSSFVTRLQKKIERLLKHAEFDDYLPFCVFFENVSTSRWASRTRFFGRSRKIGSVDSRFCVVQVASLARLENSRILGGRTQLEFMWVRSKLPHVIPFNCDFVWWFIFPRVEMYCRRLLHVCKM